MRPRHRRAHQSIRALLLLVGGVLACAVPRAEAQSDSARVSYRTVEVVFFTAGRADGVQVGDTVSVLGSDGVAIASAVVVSASLHGASARLLTPDASVATGQRVRFVRHLAAPADSLGVAAAPAGAVQALAADTAAPPLGDTARTGDTAVVRAPPPERPRLPASARRMRGGIQVEQLASSAGGASSLTSYQTVGSLSFTAPFGDAVELRTRMTSRWRSGAAANLTGMNGVFTIPYELQLRIAPPGAGWNASLGRFVPVEAVGLGYLDGARFEVQVARAQRFGVVAGFVPGVERLQVSTATKRAGAYWAYGADGPLTGSFSAAADYAAGARRRTLLSSQTSWRASNAVSVSAYSEVDVGASWQTFRGLQLTDGYVNVRADLPLGFRASLGAETHQSILLWESVLLGDTLPQPGRLNGLNASLGRDVAGFRVDLSGGLLERATDATPSIRGMLSVSRGMLFLTAMGQHGDLFDYGAFLAHLILPYRALPFNVSLGASAAFTRSAGGALTQWRYSVQPEISRAVGGGVFASFGGDIGMYAGRTSMYLHGGLSYRFR